MSAALKLQRLVGKSSRKWVAAARSRGREAILPLAKEVSAARQDPRDPEQQFREVERCQVPEAPQAIAEASQLDPAERLLVEPASRPVPEARLAIAAVSRSGPEERLAIAAVSRSDQGEQQPVVPESR
jgi:hypothetical protein